MIAALHFICESNVFRAVLVGINQNLDVLLRNKVFGGIRCPGERERNCKSMERALWIVFHTVPDNFVELKARE